MIKSFKDKEAEKIFNFQFSKKLPAGIQQKALTKLKNIDYASKLKDLSSPPGNRLEELRGRRDGQHSIRINEQWRICFSWGEGNAYEVEIVDYH
jgi:proteic killer suppression protein